MRGQRFERESAIKDSYNFITHTRAHPLQRLHFRTSRERLILLTAWILLLAFLLLVSANALFVAVEFSFLTVDREAVRSAAEKGDRIATIAERSLKKTSTNLSGAQLGITVSSLIAGFIAGPSIGTLLTELLGWTGVPRAASVGIATTAAFIIATFSQMVFGELIPKNWALAASMKVVRISVVPQAIFMATFGWLVWLLNSTANAVLRAFGFNPSEEPPDTRSGAELLSSVNRSSRVGALDSHTAELVAQTLEFGNRTAADAMLPRPLVTFVDSASAAELLHLTSTTGHARFPVIGEDVDDIRGVVHFRQALALTPEERENTSVETLAHEVPIVSESMTLDPLMRVLRESEWEMAVVVDEYGGTAGIVTLEDLLEELVGEIDDEQDQRTTVHTERHDGAIVVSGLLRPDELGGILDMELPDPDETATLTGLLSERLDRLPQMGDVVVVDTFDTANRDSDDLPTPARVRLVVEEVANNRVEQLSVTTLAPEPSDDGDVRTSEDHDSARSGAEADSDVIPDHTHNNTKEETER